jgi:glycosyltransferase involved in cell wall biosynthesis
MPAGIPTIVTLHDVFAVTDPEFFAKRRPLDHLARAYFRWLIRRSLRRARAAITDSQYSKDEIRRIFPAEPTPIAVVHLAPPEGTEVRAGTPSFVDRVGCPYVLYVGNFRSYKNVETLVRAFARRLGGSGKEELVLVLAGSDFGETMRRLSSELGISHAVRCVHRPSDDILRDLYRGARALVQPSLYEGFGLPPLEAMRAGVPVIISNAECLLEVCGNAARVFPRQDVEALARELSTVLESPELRSDMRIAGQTQAARYSWAATAEKTLKIYQSAAGTDGRTKADAAFGAGLD